MINKHISLELNIAKPLPVISIDREAFSRALINLLDNALKYSDKKGTIRLCALAEGDVVKLSVEDKGPGIRKDAQKKVFEKFYRAQDEDNRHIEGSGIGLTLVAHIVKAHGGELKFESREGEGTEFIIQLPLI